MENYETTLSETLSNLKREGYTEDFNLRIDCIDCRDGKLKIFPADFHVDKVFRFEGQSDPDEQAILYAISSPNHKVKGVLVNSYGLYADPLTNDMLSKLRTN